MGDCTSRPSEPEVNHHRQKTNRKNDKFFKMSSILTEPKTLQSLSKPKLERLLEDADKELQFFYEKLEGCTAGIDSIPEILVEIKKGVDLYEPGCFNSAKPLVRVSLEPKGPSFDTFESEKYLPEWFKLVQIKQSLASFDRLKVSVMNKSDEVLTQLGSVDFVLEDLKDQVIREDWYELKVVSPIKDLKPSIHLRIQMIRDETVLYTVLAKQINEMIDTIQELMGKNYENN